MSNYPKLQVFYSQFQFVKLLKLFTVEIVCVYVFICHQEKKLQVEY